LGSKGSITKFFEYAQCPRCKQKAKKVKEWSMVSSKNRVPLVIECFVCLSCNHKFRRAYKSVKSRQNEKG